MTPKEKAEELVDKFQKGVQIIREDNDSEKFYSIQCALIAVDEILRSHHNLYGLNNKEVKFYLEVKQEIESL
jgi:hypothetical protein